MEFTAAQIEAMDVARSHLDTCVVAGPGSGKTTVLVEYFKNLVGAGADPLRILAITFTEKAAGNMREKLAEAFESNPERRGQLERAWVSTVHGFCARLLKENAVFAGVDPDFQVAVEMEAWRMQQESVAAAMEELFEGKPAEVRALIRGLSSQDFERDVLAAYDAMRGAGVRVEDLDQFPQPPDAAPEEMALILDALGTEKLTDWSYPQKQQFESARECARRILSAPDPRSALFAIEAFACNLQKCKRGTPAYSLLKTLKDEVLPAARYGRITALYRAERRLLLEILQRFDRIYRERKQHAGGLDFGDLEEYAARLLEERGDVRERVRGQFDHILMDEFQDTNGQQARLLKLVRRDSGFYAVGDINQSIFGFRHAEPGGFRQYRDEVASHGGRLVELVDNFRSRPQILRAVETISNHAAGIEPRALVPGKRFEKPREVAVEILIVKGDELAEARWVARRMVDFLEAEPQFDYKDIALLVRNTEVLGDYGTAFDEARIPYLVNRGKGFYETREVNDLTHLLRTIANPRDEVSLATVLRSPLVEASDEALLHLKTMGDNLGAALMRLDGSALPFHADDLRKLRHFAGRLGKWRAGREYVTFDRLLAAAIDDCAYPLTPNVDKFLAQARDAAARQSLDSFVEELAMVRASNPREPDAPPEDSANAVKVMTVHSAKGLEFPVVFLAAMHKGIDTKIPVVAFSPRVGLGARWRNPAARKDRDKDDLYQHAIRQEWKVRERDESSRLLYVAMTRAEHHLVLSYTRGDRKPLNWAAALTDSLNLDPETPCDQVAAWRTPEGLEWKARVTVTDQPAETRQRAAAGPEESPVEWLDPPELTAQHDTNATVTGLTRFAACPRAYYLGHYLGFEAPHTPRPHADSGLAASEFGTQVHALLSGKAVPGADPEAVRLRDVFRESALGKRAARAGRVEREFDFLMAVEELVLTGQVDLWFEEGGELVIVDYKTNQVTAAEAHHLARDYSLQLRLYAAAVERVAGRPADRAWLHFLRPNTLVEVDLTPSLLESPELAVREFLEAQGNLDFPLREGAHCRRCEFYRGLCPSQFS